LAARLFNLTALLDSKEVIKGGMHPYAGKVT